MQISRGNFGPVAVVAALVLWLATWLPAAPARGDEEPDRGFATDIGTVAAWRAADAAFYRSRASADGVDRSLDHLDLPAIYAKTREYHGAYRAVGLAAWRELGRDERLARRDAARGELRFVADFHRRVLGDVQRVRAGEASGWGLRVSDRTVVGDLLTRLRTATGLAPDDPYAWHLTAYLAEVAGDDLRALAALRAARAALDLLPAEALHPLRAAVALDLAWLLRNHGDFAAARASLEEAAVWGATGVEPRLLQGLLAAQTGDDATAITVAGELRSARVADFPMDYATRDYVPAVEDVDVWARRASTYLRDWILAWTWLRVGRTDMARAVFGRYDPDDQRLLGPRFWDEAGTIYAATARPALAVEAWVHAAAIRPYRPYLPATGGARSVTRLTGRPGASPFELAFGENFVAGDRLAWAAELVDRVAAAYDEGERQRLASRALDQLEICRRAGPYPAQAALLQGRVYDLMGDRESAAVEVAAALDLLRDSADEAGREAILAGFGGQWSALDGLAEAYGQAGASRGRWDPDPDPAATAAGLREAYAAAPTDANRQALARFLVRNGDMAAGRELALRPLAGAAPDAAHLGALADADLAVVLEADRAAGRTAVAETMVASLNGADGNPWPQAEVWALAGFICLDGGREEAARKALERAARLDPGNQGLKLQLSLF